MSRDFDNSNSGALFRNDEKKTDKHPDYRGQINVAGTDYWLSAWLKTSKKGTKFMSLSVTPKEKPQSDPAFDRYTAGEDDSVPF